MATRLVQRESSASYQEIETGYEETDGVEYDDVSLIEKIYDGRREWMSGVGQEAAGSKIAQKRAENNKGV